MNILILNTHDIEGGAARAAYRLHKGLQHNNVDSKMLVQVKSGDDSSVIGPKNKLSKGVNKLRPQILHV